MTAKEYLSMPKALREEIQCDIDNLAAMRSIVEDCTTHLSYTAGCNPSRNKDTFENVMLDITAEEEKIEEKKRKLFELTKDILMIIQNIPEKNYQDILRLRYIFGLGWQEISAKLYLSEDYLFTLHRKALDEFEIRIPEEHF